MVIQIFRGIRERSKYNYFLIPGVDRMLYLFGNGIQQHLELDVMFWRDFFYHSSKRIEGVKIFLQIMLPSQVVHVFQLDPHLSAYREQVAFLVVRIQVPSTGEVLKL